MMEVVPKTLDQYGIGTRIPSILRGVPTLSVDNLTQLMELQNKVKRIGYVAHQANLCLRAFRRDKFYLRMPSHSEGPGIWLSV